MNKKVVLLNPKNREDEGDKELALPAGLLYIAEPLLKEGYDVKIMDAAVNSMEEIINTTKDAICVGIKIWTGYPIKSALELAKEIKKIYPKIPLVWGSWHASILPIQTIQNDYVDIVVKGPAEITFLELVKRLENKKSLKNIKGVVYKKDGKIVDTGDRALGELDLNKSNILPYHLLDMERYISKKEGDRGIFYISSRGCPFNCTFCADKLLYNSRLERSPENVLKDIKYLIDTYKINSINFKDTNFFINKEKVKKICEGIIKNKWDIKWTSYIRVDQFIHLGDDLLKLIRKSGCRKIQVGAESGSQKILDLINKRIKVESIIECAKLAKNYDIYGSYSFMVGFPNTNWDDIPKTLDMIRKIKSIDTRNKFNIWFYTPYPGTALYSVAVKHGFKDPKLLEEWCDHNNRTEFTWINQKKKKEINKFVFYVKLAYPDDYMKKIIKNNLMYKIAHKSSLFRFKYKFLSFPIEWIFYYVIKGHKKIESQD